MLNLLDNKIPLNINHNTNLIKLPLGQHGNKRLLKRKRQKPHLPPKQPPKTTTLIQKHHFLLLILLRRPLIQAQLSRQQNIKRLRILFLLEDEILLFVFWEVHRSATVIDWGEVFYLLYWLDLILINGLRLGLFLIGCWGPRWCGCGVGSLGSSRFALGRSFLCGRSPVCSMIGFRSGCVMLLGELAFIEFYNRNYLFYNHHLWLFRFFS